MQFPDVDQKSFIASPASGNESWGGGGRDASDSPRKSILLSPWIGRCRTKVDVLSSWSPPGVLIRPSAIGKINSPCLGNITESLRVDFRCVHRLQLLKVCDQYVTLPNSPRVESVSEEQSRWDFLSKLMDSWLILRSYRVILNQWTKWNNRYFKWLPNTSFVFPSDNKSVTFRR